MQKLTICALCCLMIALASCKPTEETVSAVENGPWRVMQLDSEFAGLLVAVGFLVMGLVSMPLATGFVLGAIALGVVVALLLRFTPRKLSRVMVGFVVLSSYPTMCYGLRVDVRKAAI